jgi:hypothetical protein
MERTCAMFVYRCLMASSLLPGVAISAFEPMPADSLPLPLTGGSGCCCCKFASAPVAAPAGLAPSGGLASGFSCALGLASGLGAPKAFPENGDFGANGGNEAGAGPAAPVDRGDVRSSTTSAISSRETLDGGRKQEGGVLG